jgi:DNA-directed RNA polymerase beta' subunit
VEQKCSGGVLMKFCKKSGKEMEGSAKFCQECGEEQIDKRNEKKDFVSNMSIRRFFLEVRKEEHSEQTAEKVRKFLEEKGIVELLPIAIITLEELGALYYDWKQAKEDDTMSFAELGELQKKLKAKEEKFLVQFEELINDSNSRELLAGLLSELE